MPFQKGNTYATRKGMWQNALRIAMRADPQAVTRIAKKLLKMAENGEGWAIKELADRLDGRPAQDVNIGGQEDNPLVLEPVESLTAHIRSIVAAREVIERVAEDRE
jgi:HPt (histidine-containing phosphotransfer) domain-containing protein